MRAYRHFSIFICLIYVFTFAPAFAGAETTRGKQKAHADSYDKDVLGVGLTVLPQYRGGSGTNVYLLPWFRLRWNNFFLEGDRGGYYLINEKKLRFGFAVRPRLGWHDDDAVVLRGMGDRDWSVDGGLRLRWKPLRWLGTDAFVMTDIGNASNGHLAEFSVVGAAKFGKFRMRPQVGYKWESENIVDYYYGVDAYEVLPGRSVYKGDDVLSFTASCIGLYELTDTVAMFGQVYYERLGDAIAESPLTEEKHQFVTIFGIGYQF